jgi:uncharacterized coiled-coil DUF342 family protein
MSDSQAYEEVTVASDGVTVVKRFEEDEFPVPAIAFEFTSERDEEVSVRLSDTVPEGIEVEDLGFHPEYGSEYWTIDDNTITFERDLSANSSYTTVYGIRATGSDNVEQFLTEPTLGEVDPPLPEDEKGDEDIIPESGDDVVKDAISGDGEIPGLEDEDGDESEEDEDVETLNLKDPNEPQQATQQTEASGEESTTDADEAGEVGEAGEAGEVSVEGGSIVAAMANEIRQKNVSADDVKLLRRAFEIAGQDGGSTAAKLQQIQTDIADLRAYTNSLEEFLDENGTAEEMIGGFEEQLDNFSSQLDALQSEIESNSGELDSVSEEMNSVSDEIDSVSEDIESMSNEIGDVNDKVDTVSGRVDSVTSDVNSVSEEVDSVSEEMESMSEEVDSVSEEIESVSGEVDSVGDELERFDSAIDDIESEIETLEKKVTDGDVAERLDTIEDNLEDLHEWQDQIKQTFGG